MELDVVVFELIRARKRELAAGMCLDTRGAFSGGVAITVSQWNWSTIVPFKLWEKASHSDEDLRERKLASQAIEKLPLLPRSIRATWPDPE